MIHHFEMVSGTCGLHALQGAPSACSRIVCLDQSQRSVCLRTRPSQWERCVKGRSILNRLASLRGKKASCSSGRSLIFQKWAKKLRMDEVSGIVDQLPLQLCVLGSNLIKDAQFLNICRQFQVGFFFSDEKEKTAI